MLAVALNCIDTMEGKELGSMLINLFDDFKVVKISPCGDADEGRLQFCQPEEYGELLKVIQKYQDPSETFLELRGPKAKLQKAIRYMLFFDEEKKYKKVLLEGCDGITDFPWAIQIVMIEPPVLGWKQEPEWIRKADVVVLNNLEKEQSREFIAKVKKIRPHIPVFAEKLQEGLSKELMESLETLFADYVEKRDKIKDILELQYPKQLISCAQARRMSGDLRVSSSLVGSVCDELGYRITQCGLGCF